MSIHVRVKSNAFFFNPYSRFFFQSILTFFFINVVCSYCGARDTSGWNVGPWGSRTLCIVHYVQWRQNNTLNLDEWSQTTPTRPIAPEYNTEWKYKHFKLLREKMVAKTSKNRVRRGVVVARYWHVTGTLITRSVSFFARHVRQLSRVPIGLLS